MTPEFDLSDPDAVAFCPSCGSGYTARATRCEPCDVALIPRAQAETASTEAPPSDIDEAAADEATVSLCQLVDPAKANLLGLELEQAGVPYWVRMTPLDPFGLPGFTEFRVPERYIDEARDGLRRIEEYPSGGPTDDVTV